MILRRSRKLFTVLISAVAIFWFSATAWGYGIGHTTMSFKDAARGINIPVEIYYPADTAGENVPVANGQFPLLVFGHGYMTPVPIQHYYWEGLVPEGYVMAFPTTRTGSSINIDSYGKDISFLLASLLDRTIMKDTMFAFHLDGTSAFMGYSMGGGASFLAQADESLADTIVGIAPVGKVSGMGTSIYGTNPVDVTEDIFIPVLIMAGELDCICPVSRHQTPLYSGLSSDIKVLVTITNGSHCGFSDVSLAYGCPAFEESFCPSQTGSPISNITQVRITIDYIHMWLDAILKGDVESWAAFEKSLSEDTQVNDSFTGEDEWPPETLAVPQLTQEVEGITGTLFWDPVPGANFYTLFYALYPYDGSIKSVNMGNMTSLQGDLWSGASFYFAVQAGNESGSSDYSNVELMIIP